MNKISFNYLIILFLVVFSCSEVEENRVSGSNKADKRKASPVSIGNKVMMQAFYWDCPDGGVWWNVVNSKISSWAAVGIDAIWLPPVSKAQNGPFSMGYDPYDYFDLGAYNQMGSTETRFGTESQLRNLIQTAHTYNIGVIADIVINHNSGGASESNPFTGNNTWTGFTPASGKFNRSFYDFHPNDHHHNDYDVFGGFPDLCHHKSYVQDWLWKEDYSVAHYYMHDVGFDGWRFDFVKGFEPWVVNQWLEYNGGFSVGEYWDSNVDTLDWWTTEANSSAFDFACYYAMNDAFDGNNLTKLNNDMLWKRNPMRTVTFVTNHDTDEIWEKMLAYAYILTHEGYPCIFYRDYEEWLDKDKLNNLIWIHNNLASGTTTNLYTDNDEYITRRNGYDSSGLVVYINNSNFWQERWIDTNWTSTQIKDYTGNSSWEPTTELDKKVKIQAPPKSYTIWSVK